MKLLYRSVLCYLHHLLRQAHDWKILELLALEQSHGSIITICLLGITPFEEVSVDDILLLPDIDPALNMDFVSQQYEIDAAPLVDMFPSPSFIE